MGAGFDIKGMLAFTELCAYTLYSYALDPHGFIISGIALYAMRHVNYRHELTKNTHRYILLSKSKPTFPDKAQVPIST